MKILLAEDDLHIRQDIAKFLCEHDFLVDEVDNGRDAWFRGDTETYAAIILDLGLPDMDGMDILRQWREQQSLTPVLVLTARGNWDERVRGIDAGADDYLVKPFRMEELLARLRSIIRRSGGQAASVIHVNELTIDTRFKQVTKADKPISLSRMEFLCLHYLALHANRVVSRQELTEQLYAQDFERDSNSVEVLVGRLRRKLGRDQIETRRGFGYLISTER